MNENWLEIVSALRPYFDNNSTEDAYQREIESCLQILGWKRFNRTMMSQCTRPIGNNNSIRLDILLRKNEMNVLPIEIKRPSNICNERQELQLMSYMRQLRVNIGVYIGEKIRLYYDNPNDSMDAVCVFSTKINEEDSNGAKLCELLNYTTFDKDTFEAFCKQEYEKMQTRRSLHQLFSEYFSEENGVANLQTMIKNKFLTEGYDDLSIEEVMKSLQIAVTYSPKINVMQRVTEPIELSYSAVRKAKTLTYASDSDTEKKKTYTRTAPITTLKVTFSDGTVIVDNSAIEVERQFIIKVGTERVRNLGITQCKEDLIGHPETMRNPKYIGRWKELENGLYIFTCSNNGDKIKHIMKIINALGLNAKVELLNLH